MAPAELNRNRSTGATEPRDRRLVPLGALMQSVTPAPMPLQEHLEGRARLRAAVDDMRTTSRRTKVAAWSFGSTFAAAAAVLAVIFGWKAYANRPMAYDVEGATTTAGGYVSAAPGAPAKVRFGDGSEVDLAGGARGRVASTTADGADVVLEEGRADVHVVHRQKTKWTVDAGPYAVRVTGTKFVVAWSASGATLDVWMREGRVVVTGPEEQEGVALVTGQHLRAEAGALTIDGAAAPSLDETLDDAAPTTTPSSAAPPATGASDLGPSTSPPADGAGSGAPAAVGPTWPSLVGSGKYGDVLQQANDEGVDRALGSRRAGDLRALGDAARYTGNAGLATKAYTSIRSRFPGSGEARTAAFLLGRVAEEQLHSAGVAMKWYDTYLAEAPSGPFAGDALGRKMVLTSRAEGAAAAKPLAADYLRRFPRGAYASAAKNIDGQ